LEKIPCFDLMGRLTTILITEAVKESGGCTESVQLLRDFGALPAQIIWFHGSRSINDGRRFQKKRG
jgi:hypothetical protein